MFHAKKMRSEDFPFAVQLANTMDWNMAKSDLEFMAKLEPDGCFVLWEGDERVGMATCISYGKVGWFGNLAVKPEYRRKGAGTFLVRHAVQYLKGKGVETVGLYAYQHLVGFYRRVGFEPCNESVVLNGEPVNAFGHREALKEAGRKEIPALSEFDSACSGWNRKRLFESILGEKGNLCYVSTANGKIAGFILAKVYDEMAEIGPLACQQAHYHVAVELLGAVLNRLKGLDVYVCVPLKEKKLLKALIEVGLKENFRLTRMFLGSITAQNCVYVPESMERG